MPDRQHCQCAPGCQLLAELDQPYAITHDARPERQAERRRVMAERGTLGGLRGGENRRAVAAEDAEAADLSSTQGRRDALNRACRRVFASSVDPAKLANAIAGLIRAALEVDRVGELEQENRELRQLLLEKHPELRTRLRSVP
jgi:hypothetical protein